MVLLFSLYLLWGQENLNAVFPAIESLVPLWTYLWVIVVTAFTFRDLIDIFTFYFLLRYNTYNKVNKFKFTPV